MAGFGGGSFGNRGFGRWAWSRQVLFDHLPVKYRAEDAENGNLLSAYAEGLRPAFDRTRLAIERYDDLRDPRYVRADTTESTVLTLGRSIPVRGVVEQRGLDGLVETGTQYFTSRTARFSAADIGKELVLINPLVLSNKEPVQISAIISVTSVTTTPLLEVETDPVRWEVRIVTSATDYALFEIQDGDASAVQPGWSLTDGAGFIDITARRQLRNVEVDTRLLTERQGSDAEIDSNGTVAIPTGLFIQRDVGKKISISGSSSETNNELHTICRVISGTEISTSFLHVRGETSTGGVGYSSYSSLPSPPTIEHRVAGILTSLSIETDGRSIVVHLATNGAGEAASLASEVVAAVNSDTDASELITAQLINDGTGRCTALSETVIPGALLAADAGPLFWALRPRAQIRTRTRTVPNGIVEKEGVDLEITTTGTPALLSIPSFRGTSDDIGKRIKILGSEIGNDGLYEITDVPSAFEIEVDAVLIAEEGPLFWELRAPTLLGNSIEVEAKAPGILPTLAADFGLEIDRQESAARQRAAITHHPKWMDRKGTYDGYRILGALSGFDVEARQLFRVTQNFFEMLPAENAFQVGDTDPGRYGADGSLEAGNPGRVRFSAPSALLELADVGAQVFIQDSGSSNDGLYTIDSFLDAQTVEFRLGESATVPDANNGFVRWGIARLYTDQRPLIPNFDDFNTDALEEYIEDTYGPDLFTVDMFCWEEDWITTMQVEITAVTSFTPVNHAVMVVISPPPLADILEIIPDSGVPSSLGKFMLTDSAGTEYLLESYPAASGTDATFSIISTVPPVTGDATIDYICTPQSSCDYCDASVVFVRILADTILAESGVAIQRMLDRMLDKLETEVKPHHVTLVPSFQQTVTGVLNLSAGGVVDARIASSSMTGTGTVFADGTVV